MITFEVYKIDLTLVFDQELVCERMTWTEPPGIWAWNTSSCFVDWTCWTLPSLRLRARLSTTWNSHMEMKCCRGEKTASGGFKTLTLGRIPKQNSKYVDFELLLRNEFCHVRPNGQPARKKDQRLFNPKDPDDSSDRTYRNSRKNVI